MKIYYNKSATTNSKYSKYIIYLSLRKLDFMMYIVQNIIISVITESMLCVTLYHYMV